MRHAIVGAGGVGGLMAATLVLSGEQVTVVLRPATLPKHPDSIHLDTPSGSFDAPVKRAICLDSHFDVVWLSTKATHLEEAVNTLQAGRDRFDLLVPLLNGVEHVAQLRALFGNARVVPATISVESERVSPGHIVRRSPFCKLAVAGSGRDKLAGVLEKLSHFDFECEFVDDETTLMWRKLIFLAPLALTSSASGKTVGEMRQDPVWHEQLVAAIHETGAVAKAEGARVNVDVVVEAIDALPAGMKSSMQKDVEAGREPEVDAIGGPIVRGGERHGVPTPVISRLMAAIRERSGVRGA